MSTSFGINMRQLISLKPERDCFRQNSQLSPEQVKETKKLADEHGKYTFEFPCEVRR